MRPLVSSPERSTEKHDIKSNINGVVKVFHCRDGDSNIIEFIERDKEIANLPQNFFYPLNL